MSREESLVRSLLEMADTLVDDYLVVDRLGGLADRCVNLLGVAAGGHARLPPRVSSAWWPLPATSSR